VLRKRKLRSKLRREYGPAEPACIFTQNALANCGNSSADVSLRFAGNITSSREVSHLFDAPDYLAIRQTNSMTAAPTTAAMTVVNIPPPSASNSPM
jgi:hypothetical protein